MAKIPEPQNSLDDSVPDALPESLKPQSVDDFIQTLYRFCDQSGLSRAQLIGGIEIAKHSIMEQWLEDDMAVAEDDEGDEVR